MEINLQIPYISPSNIIFVSGNQNKCNEMNQILNQILKNCDNENLEFYNEINLGMLKIDLVEIQPEGKGNIYDWAKEITKHKAIECQEKIKQMIKDKKLILNKKTMFIIEDSSLNLLGLINHFPGPFIKFTTPLLLIQMIGSTENKKALASCQFSCFEITPDINNLSNPELLQFSEITFCEGTCTGTIANEPRGTLGFGWDTVFIIDPQFLNKLNSNEKKEKYNGKTYAEILEMSKDDKNNISQRRIACEELFKFILFFLKNNK